jgi:hypothetical protein
MARNKPRFGFPVKRGYQFRLHGQPYVVGASSIRTLKLLADIYRACVTCDDGSWPFRLRPQIRQVQAIEATPVLCLVVERTDDPTLRILAIWLRGRCGGSLGTASLAEFATAADDRTRKEVARALKRLGAWAPLREMAEHDPDPRIRRIATARPARPYRQRLAEYTQRVSRVSAATGQQPLVVAPDLDLSQGRPPKSRSFIRAILERIHRLVTGQKR